MEDGEGLPSSEIKDEDEDEDEINFPEKDQVKEKKIKSTRH